jgi:hypothetical protein
MSDNPAFITVPRHVVADLTPFELGLCAWRQLLLCTAQFQLSLGTLPRRTRLRDC